MTHLVLSGFRQEKQVHNNKFKPNELRHEFHQQQKSRLNKNHAFCLIMSWMTMQMQTNDTIVTYQSPSMGVSSIIMQSD